METPTVGKQLRLFRESRNMKQLEFCDYTGIKQQTISGIETGRSEPSTAMLQLLFTKFPDLNPDWLLLGTGSMLRDGRTLTPAGPPTQAETATQAAGNEKEAEKPEPPNTPTGGQMQVVRPTYDELLAENASLHKRLDEKDDVIADLRTDKGNLWQQLQRAKTSASSNAADHALHVSHSNPTAKAAPIGPRFDDEVVMYIAA